MNPKRVGRGRARCVAAVLALAAMLAPGAVAAPAGATPAPIVVDTTADGHDVNPGDGVCAMTDGRCSLRAAYQEGMTANRAVSVPAGDYTLTLGQLYVAKTIGQHGVWSRTTPGFLVISGAGPGLTHISGGGGRVFDVATDGWVWASGMTITGAGGMGVYSHQHGGAVHNHGTFTLSNATIRFANLNASTAMRDGGALYNASGATALLVNVTIGNNYANERGGGVFNGGALELYSTTIAKSYGGAGLYTVAGSTTRLDHTLLGQNSGANCVGPITSAVHSMADDASCTGVPNVGDARLDPYYGDGRTLPLLAGSPAIDGGAATCPSSGSKDQRGQSRPADGNGDGFVACDVGAYEAAPPPRLRLQRPLRDWPFP
ncbi:MAG: choice-of-anchor Q domain-containing protein [Acidimicrobiales bacterium]